MASFRMPEKTAVFGIAVFLVAGAGYVLCDAVLLQNSLKISAEGAHKQGDFNGLVNWLPKSAKTAIEFRARSLYLQNRMKRTKDPDDKVTAVYDFAAYIKARDPKGSDAVMTSIVTRPEFAASRKSYLGYAALLLDQTSARPVTVAELHKRIAALQWPEDQYNAWCAVSSRLAVLKAEPELYAELYAPLLQKLPEFRNYERFFTELERKFKKMDPEQAEKYAALRMKLRLERLLPAALLKAPVSFRNDFREAQERLKEAKTTEQKLLASVSLALLWRSVDDFESEALFARMLKDREFQKEPRFYQVLAPLLNCRKKELRIGIERYHKEIFRQTDPQLRFDAWSEGCSRLQNTKAKPQQMMTYLEPLLAEDVKYQDYAELFRLIVQNARLLKQEEKALQAEKFLERVQDTVMPSLSGDEGGE